jgi:hypothetical protein
MKSWNVWAALRKPKDMKEELESAEGSGNDGLLYVIGMDGDLIELSPGRSWE